jgi:hypothetical protein
MSTASAQHTKHATPHFGQPRKSCTPQEQREKKWIPEVTSAAAPTCLAPFLPQSPYRGPWIRRDPVLSDRAGQRHESAEERGASGATPCQLDRHGRGPQRSLRTFPFPPDILKPQPPFRCSSPSFPAPPPLHSRRPPRRPTPPPWAARESLPGPGSGPMASRWAPLSTSRNLHSTYGPRPPRCSPELRCSLRTRGRRSSMPYCRALDSERVWVAQTKISRHFGELVVPAGVGKFAIGFLYCRTVSRIPPCNFFFVD